MVLTSDTIFFSQYCCGGEDGITIPLNTVSNVKSESSWLGRTQIGMKHLIIEYEFDGEQDAIGFLVRDLNSWINQLQQYSK